MITGSRTLTLAALIAVATFSISAQTPRDPRSVPSNQPVITAAPLQTSSVKAKYEGGVIGYPQKREGTLTFDDGNRRLLFRDKKGSELFSIPYRAIQVVYADTRSYRPTGARVAASTVPYGLGLPALLIKNKKRYLAMQYLDDEAQVSGNTSFKIDSQQLLQSLLETVGRKAEMIRRGEIFVRPRSDRNATDRREIRETVTLPPPM